MKKKSGKPNFNTKIIPFEKSHKAGNCERGDPLRFFNIHSVAKYQKNERRTLWGHLKNFEKKVSQSRKGGRGSLISSTFNSSKGNF